MKIPHELKPLLEKATTEVKSSPTGELMLPMRRRIWSKIIDLCSDDLSSHRILTALDSECVRHTIHIWEEVFPNDNGPSHMLEIAQQILDKKLAIAEAEELRDRYYVDVVENRKYQPNQYPAMFVGHAAINTILTAFVELEEDPDYLAKQDEDLDPDGFEPSYLAASAYSGGFLGNGDTDKRREFWLWYLQTAVQRAYEHY